MCNLQNKYTYPVDGLEASDIYEMTSIKSKYIENDSQMQLCYRGQCRDALCGFPARDSIRCDAV